MPVSVSPSLTSRRLRAVPVIPVRHHSTSKPCCSSHASSSSTLASPLPPNRTPRLRFAPSPTGYLHLGGLRTALFNYLLARKWKGKWILRIEDTDQSRLVPDAVQNLQDTLEWVGLEYDEGPGVGGSKGPYVQSERLDLYHDYADRLLESDHAYRCFCPPTLLTQIRSEQQAKKATTAYDGRCRHLTDEEVRRKREAGEKFVIRYKSPDFIVPNPPDLIFGAYSNHPSPPSPTNTHADWSRPSPPSLIPHASALGSSGSSSSNKGKEKGPGLFANNDKEDFILVKSDGWPTYHLASVVDDWEMGVTHVMRGEEWLPSTTKHVQLYHALGLTPPEFAHLPLLINADGTKLSKRTGDVAVGDYKKRGYEPTALLNFLGLMGWDHHRHGLASGPFFPPSATSASLNPAELRHDLNSLTELLTLPALTSAFDLQLVNHRRAAVFMPKLDWLNKMHLRRAGMRREGGEEEERIQHVMQDEAGVRRDREWLVQRLMGLLKEKKVFEGCALIEDDEYVGRVLDVELPRATVLSDIPDLSVFFFLDPEFGNLEAQSMVKSSTFSYKTYMSVVKSVYARLAAQTDEWSHDGLWDLIKGVMEELEITKRPSVVTPMRHALTGRKNGPPLPEVMLTLGREACLRRLQRAIDHSATTQPSRAASD